MTYCLGVLVKNGFVLIADTRTNAGIDYLSHFQKIFCWKAEDRWISIAVSGNLAVTQLIINYIDEGIANKLPTSILKVDNMFECVRAIGSIVRQVYESEGEFFLQHEIHFDPNILVAGRIMKQEERRDSTEVNFDVQQQDVRAPGGQVYEASEDDISTPARLFKVYPIGNYIEATYDTPFFQIGDHKYGKPVLDSLCQHSMSLDEALKIMFMSMEQTASSNLSVGYPVDLVFLDGKEFRWKRVEEEDEYIETLRQQLECWMQSALKIVSVPDYCAKSLDLSSSASTRGCEFIPLLDHRNHKQSACLDLLRDKKVDFNTSNDTRFSGDQKIRREKEFRRKDKQDPDRHIDEDLPH